MDRYPADRQKRMQMDILKVHIQREMLKVVILNAVNATTPP